MRITSSEAQAIRRTVAKIFGSEARTWLFGSRTDDNKRGGDIDLLIETPHNIKQPLQKTLELELALQEALGDQKIDILIKHGGMSDSAFQKMARSTGILL